MDEITTIFGGIGRLLAIVGGGISAISVCYSGIMWMTASGDPQNMAKARTALLGAVGGLVIVGISFIVPRIIGETVIEPVGGSITGTESSQNCDDILRNQFVFQRNASTTDSLNAVISTIQNQRIEQCSVDVWKPVVVDAIAAVSPAPIQGCYTAPTDTTYEKIDQQDVPSGLHVGGADSIVNREAVRLNSGRDRDNNIIIHWASDNPPTDDAICWLYVYRLSTWSVEY